jgi:hypothetical protein
MPEVAYSPAFSAKASNAWRSTSIDNGVVPKEPHRQLYFLLITIEPTMIPTVADYCGDE